VTNNKAVVEAYLGHGTAERLQKNVAQAQAAQEAQA
jgi:branched-chain amino acid transport system ATP-binding protein